MDFWLVLIPGSGSLRHETETEFLGNGNTKTLKFKTWWGERKPRVGVKRVDLGADGHRQLE
jgi:hypothetical protein